MLDRAGFFKAARLRFFGGVLTQPQVNGMSAILDEWEHRALTDLRWLAYMLATALWETNKTMQPVREAYWLSEDWRRQNLRYYPYYGRGFVQLTWARNYIWMGRLLNVDLVNFPDRAMDLPIATQVLFEGMLRAESGVGDFTNHSLEEFFNETTADWVGARTIINGLDRADEIADIGRTFHNIIKANQ